MARVIKTTDRVSQFAEKNLKNKKEFGEDARLAFKRHLNDLKRSDKDDPTFPYVFVPEKVEDIIELANELTIAEGEGNQEFTCDGFQEFILLTVTTAASGIKTDYKTILTHLHTLIDTYEIDLIAIAYDPHNASAFLLDLEDFGCDLIETAQSARSLNDATIDFQLEVKAHNIEYDERNKLLTRSMNDAILSQPNSFGEIKIDKMLQKNRIDPCDAVICAHKKAMEVEVEEITTDQKIEAYLKMFEKEAGTGDK